MDISYDPSKRETTLRERGLDFADAVLVFAGPHTVEQDLRYDYPEPRFITAGWLAEKMVVLVWTPTKFGRRIISMRHCHAKEQQYWRETMGRH